MKKLIAIIAVGMSLVGCASTPSPDPGMYAKQSCIDAGFVPGTNTFSSCFIRLLEIKDRENSKPTAVQQYLINRANAPRSRDVICKPWLNGIRCEEW